MHTKIHFRMSDASKIELVKNEFLTEVPTLQFTAEYRALKNILFGDSRAPYPWLQHFCNSAFNTFTKNNRGVLEKTCDQISRTEADAYFKSVPFAKRVDLRITDEFVFQQNHYFTLLSADQRPSRDCLQFATGYSDTCSHCAPLAIIWDALFSNAVIRGGTMQEKLHNVSSNSDTILAKQTELALSITHVFKDSGFDKEEAVDELVRILHGDFPPLFHTIVSRLTPAPVHEWQNRETLSTLISTTLRFCVTGAWALPKLLNFIRQDSGGGTDRLLFAWDTLQDIALLLTSTYSNYDEVTRWLSAQAGLIKNMHYVWDPHSAEIIVFNVPFLLVFLLCYSAEEIIRLWGRRKFLLLAGLISTNQIFFQLLPAGESLFASTTSSVGSHGSGWMDHIIRNPTGLWINLTQPQRNLSQARRRRVNELCLGGSFEGACRSITSFVFPYLSNRLNSMSLFISTRQWDVERATREFSMFATQEEIFSQAQRRRLQDAQMDRSLFPVSEELSVSRVISRALGYDRDQEEDLVDIKHEDAMRVFMVIRGLWAHIFIKIFSRNILVEGGCIVMDYAQNVRVNEFMEPCLLEGARFALQGMTDEVFARSVNQKIWRNIFTGENRAVCKYLSLPDAKEWAAPEEAYESEQGAGENAVKKFFLKFEGFGPTMMASLSEFELNPLVEKYAVFEFPGVETWGPHLAFKNCLGTALLHLKARPTTIGIDTIATNKVMEVEQVMHTVYSLAILHLMAPRPVCTLSESLLMRDEGFAFYLAKHYVAKPENPVRLVETALAYLAKHHPMRVEERGKVLFQLMGDVESIEAFFAGKLANGGFVADFEFVSAHNDWGKQMRNMRDIRKTKAEALLRACCVMPSYPDMQILATHNWKQLPVSILVKYYTLNHDILAAAMIHKLSLITALCVEGENKLNIENMWKGIEEMLQYARVTFMVSEKKMLLVFLFIMDYFVLYHAEDYDGIQRTSSEQMKHLNDTLQNHQDRIMRKVAGFMLGANWGDIRVRAADCLLEAVKRLGLLIHEVYLHEEICVDR